MKSVLTIAYIGAAIGSFVKCSGEGYWGAGTSLSLLLTLPWSLSMTVFAWTLAHDGTRSLLVFLVPFAALNAFLLYKATSWLTRRQAPSDASSE